MVGFTDKPLSGRSEDIFAVGKYINGLSSFILECDTPMTVAVQGDWGSGKTSFMMLIQEALGEKVLPVWFNTWQFSQFNLGDRLPLLLVSRLIDSLGLKGIQTDSIKSSLRTLGGVLFRVGLSAASTVTGLDVAGAAEEAMSSGEEDVTEAISTLKDRFQDCVKKALEEANKKTQNSDGPKKDRVVFFVDDLDRLEPARAVELLEVLKLFLDCDRCVFLLAIDYSVVSQGIRQKYGESLGVDKGRSFFDKIIQLPFKMPVAHYKIGNFIQAAMEQMHLSVNDAAPYVSLIQTSIGYNPRGMKRLLNAFLLLQRIHSDEQLDQEHEKRPLFAVLCLQLSYEEVYNFVVRSSGQLTPEFFNQLTQPAQILAELSDEDADDETEEETDPLFHALFQQWELDDSANVNRIANFMKSFRDALATTDGKLTQDDLKLLENILNFSATTTAETDAAPSRPFASNGRTGKGIRYKTQHDKVATYYKISDSIGTAGKDSGWGSAQLEAFRLFGQEVTVQTFSEMLLQVLAALYQRDSERFLSIQRNPADYRLASLFIGTGGSFKYPAQLPGINITVETKNNNHTKISFLRRMMTAMGYNPDDLELKVRLAHYVE